MLETMGQAKHWMQMLPGSGKTLTQALTGQHGRGLSLQTEEGSVASTVDKFQHSAKIWGSSILLAPFSLPGHNCDGSHPFTLQWQRLMCHLCRAVSTLGGEADLYRKTVLAAPLLDCKYPHMASQVENIFAASIRFRSKVLA